MDQLILLVETIITRLRQGKTVVAHCNGGKGRSGTVVVAALIGLGRKVEHSIDIVRRSRSGTIRNPLQIAYVKKFKTVWRKRHKEKMATAQPADEEDEELMDPEELAIWKKWEEKLLHAGDEEKDSVKSPMIESVIESDERTSDDGTNPGAGNGTGGGTGLSRASSTRQGTSPSGSKDKKRDSGLRGSLWKKKEDKKEDNKGKTKEELKSEEKKRKQEKMHAKKVEKRQKALEKQKLKVAKEAAKLLAAQSPPLAVGASRRSTDAQGQLTQPPHQESDSATANNTATHNISNPGATGASPLTHSGLNETMTTVAEVKEDENSSHEKTRNTPGSIHSDSRKSKIVAQSEKRTPQSPDKKEHEGSPESSERGDTSDETTVDDSTETSTEQDSS